MNLLQSNQHLNRQINYLPQLYLYTPPYIPQRWSKAEPMLDPATLPPQQKQQLWAGIKKLDPALAEMLTTDANIAELKRVFDAKVIFTEAEAMVYLGDS